MQKVNCNIMVKATFSISIDENLKGELDKEIAKGRLGANRSSGD
jgi:metal-responsive CopG/Arc/MetJ family transcriptional regulator